MPARPSTAQDNPNAALRDVLLKFFADGHQLAALRYRIVSQAIKMPLQAVVRGGPLQAPPSLPQHADLHAIVKGHINDHLFVRTLSNQISWHNGKRAAEFVTLLCADLENLDSRVAAASFNSLKLGGGPSLAQIRMEPSADLTEALSRAIALQCAGDAGRAVTGGVTVPASSTCIVVCLLDTASLRAGGLAEQRPPSRASPSLALDLSTRVREVASYTHRFALLVDGTGVGLYQAWGSGSSTGGSDSVVTGTGSSNTSINISSSTGGSGGGGGGSGGSCSVVGGGGCRSGYTLQDWLQLRSPAPMSYEEAVAFAHTFQEFCGCLNWDGTTNRLYEQLFGVDLAAGVEAEGGRVALPGRIRSWVRILVVPYVTAARVRTNARLFM